MNELVSTIEKIEKAKEALSEVDEYIYFFEDERDWLTIRDMATVCDKLIGRLRKRLQKQERARLAELQKAKENR